MSGKDDQAEQWGVQFQRVTASVVTEDGAFEIEGLNEDGQNGFVQIPGDAALQLAAFILASASSLTSKTLPGLTPVLEAQAIRTGITETGCRLVIDLLPQGHLAVNANPSMLQSLAEDARLTAETALQRTPRRPS